MDIACFMGYLLQTTVKDCERVEEINAFIKGAICDAQCLGRCIHAYQLLLQAIYTKGVDETGSKGQSSSDSSKQNIRHTSAESVSGNET
ncbi:hypothetical protein Tco_0750368 [Tanacetum coccineum]|uniref:Uncharacterized protein n=1 Tax=Tanacetum coccineum TaxID=301880 RepID=A0ABQ4Z3U1_9ASTR